MARIRTVKPEFFSSPDIAACSMAARLLAIGLLQLADGRGRFAWVAKQVEAHVFPFDDVDLEALALELERAGWVLRYSVGGRLYAEIPNFNKHQRISGKESSIESRIPERIQSDAEGSTKVLPREAPSCFPGKHLDAQEQGTGKGNREGIPPNPPSGGSTSRPRRRKPPATSADAHLLFDHFQALHTAERGKPSRKTLASFAKMVSPRIDEHGLDACQLVLTWAFTSPHPRAVTLRGGDYHRGETLWRPSKFESYLDMADASEPVGAPLPVPAGAPEADGYVAWSEGVSVEQTAEGVWRPRRHHLIDRRLPWRAELEAHLRRCAERQASGERVDRMHPGPVIEALGRHRAQALPEVTQVRMALTELAQEMEQELWEVAG